MHLAIPIEGLTNLLNSLQLPRLHHISENIFGILADTFATLETVVNITVESLKAIVAHEVEEITTAKCQVDVAKDPHWGYIYIITLHANASEALRVNLELQKRHPGVPIVVKWRGAADVTKEELIERILEIARAGGFKAKAPPGFDAVQAVREDREDRWHT